MAKLVKLMGKKRGMTQLFDENGHIVVCTVIHAEPNVVTQLKTKENDGYSAIQMGYDKVVAKDPRRKESRTKKPQRGHFARSNVDPRRHLEETRLDDLEGFELGQEVTVSQFAVGDFVDVTGVSKGKGYQGVMKLYNFAGGPASHGSKFHRAHGSTGCRSTPGRTLPGGTVAKRMGGRRVTTQGLQIVKVCEDDNVIVLKGCVPGPKGALVTLSEATKKKKK